MAGRPFSGPSGEVLNYLLKENGVDRNDILLSNVVLCAPDAGKVPPEAIKACAPRVAKELAGVKLIIAAGSEAVNLLIGRGSIDRYRGYRITDSDNGRVYVATNNPALVLRDDSTFPNLRKDFRRAFNPLPEPTLPEVEVIEDVQEAKEYVLRLRESPQLVASDIESRGGLTHKATIVCMQFATEGGSAVVLGERGGIWEDRDFIENFLRPLFESRLHNFVWHNGKFDTKILRYGYGIEARVDQDTLLMNYACDERGGVHGLEYCLMEEFGWPDYEPDSVKKFKKTGVVENYDELHTYAGWDAAGTLQLYERLLPRIEEEKTRTEYEKLLREGNEATIRMELAGFRYNVQEAADLMENEVGPELKEQELKLRTLIDKPLYKPRSTKQNPILFYDEWKIRHAMQDRPDKKRSVDEAALNEIVAGRFTTRLDDKRPLMQAFAKELLRFRELDKQASTYIVGMIERAIDDPEGRIYTDLLLHGTVTGRPSSRNPNLLNITRTKEGLPDIRKLFIPSHGRQIVAADYSQAELRTIAWLSQDAELLRNYREDKDLHSLAAERFYGEGFSSEQRSKAKNMNFGVAYGQSAATFQEKHEIPEKEAQRFIDWWWQYFGGVKEWKQRVIKEMRTGRVTTGFGRVRRFHLLTKENINAAIREAVNFVPQSVAADFTLLAVIRLGGGYSIQPEIDCKRASLILTVYDSIIADVEDSYVDEYKRICKEVMESRPHDELGWTIPFKADIGVGPTWAEAK
jgi:DNA polymerase-1